MNCSVQLEGGLRFGWLVTPFEQFYFQISRLVHLPIEFLNAYQINPFHILSGLDLTSICLAKKSGFVVNFFKSYFFYLKRTTINSSL